MEKFTKGKMKAYMPEGSNGFWQIDKCDDGYKPVATLYHDNAEADACLMAVAGEMYEFIKSLQLDVANSVKQDELLAKARGEYEQE